ncbi:MAG: peptide chain release factor aRF-1, partial [Candidatus Geothermarchaeales archaeon]
MPSEVGVELSHRDRFRLRRLIRDLKKKEGRGTELVSLYVPPKKRIAEVMNDLREEHSTASNIKSDLTRKHVQEAITKTLERLKFYDQAPDTGLVVFCGAIPTNGIGSERMEIYTVVPPEPVNIRFYRCDSHFHLGPLEEILEEKEVYGLFAIDTKDAAIAILEGSRLDVLSTHTSGIPGKSRAGGQSARRFERLREMEINEYFRRVSTYINEAFLDPDFYDRIEGVIVGDHR